MQILHRPVVLIVLDGWGIAPEGPSNPISQAALPNFKKYWAGYPHTKLLASGEAVGLPKGEAGNSEVGHLNMGAGVIVYQDLFRINRSITDGSFFQNPALLSAIKHTKERGSTLHLLGLVGPSVVHSSLEHLYALLRLAKEQGVSKVLLHAFTDGRDSPPTSAQIYLSEISQFMKSLGLGKIATIIGRYYAMDRDLRWERTQKAYALLTEGKGRRYHSFLQAISDSYKKGATDEFIEPIVLADEEGRSYGAVSDHDAVIFFNFRNDRPRQLTRAFILPEFLDFPRDKKIKDLFFVTFTSYEKDLPVSGVVLPPTDVALPLARVISGRGLRQLHLSESEKFPHVTYFFNGGREDAFPDEDRIEIPSPKVSTYDLQPEMSAESISEVLCERVNENLYDFILVNFANADMVAHTGVFKAGIKAAEVLDQILGKIVAAITQKGGTALIVSDHGNLEAMVDPDTGATDTEHNTNPVPFICVEGFPDPRELPMGILADIAPTILGLLDIPVPSAMTARDLLG